MTAHELSPQLRRAVFPHRRRRQTGWTRPALFLALAVCLLLTSAARARAEDASVAETITAAADAHGVSAGLLVRLATCESGLDPGITGDRGHSHGLYQLSDLPGTGLLWHFYSVGFDNAYDPEQAAEYVARVASGEWAAQGVGLWRWSCYGRA